MSGVGVGPGAVDRVGAGGPEAPQSMSGAAALPSAAPAAGSYLFGGEPAPIAGLSCLSTSLLLAGLASSSATEEERIRLFRTAEHWPNLDAAVTAAYDIWQEDWAAFNEEVRTEYRVGYIRYHEFLQFGYGKGDHEV